MTPTLEEMLSGFGKPAAPNPMAFDLGVGLGDVGANATAGSTDWMGALSKFLGGSIDTKTGIKDIGAGGAVLGGLQGLAGLWSGMKNYGLAKEQLAFSKDSFNKNYNNSLQSYNTNLEGRATEMKAAQGAGGMSVADYMAKHGIKG